MIYPKTHRPSLRDRLGARNLPDIPVIMAHFGWVEQQPVRVFPNGSDIMAVLGLDLGGLTSSQELTALYVAQFIQQNRLVP